MSDIQVRSQFLHDITTKFVMRNFYLIVTNLLDIMFRNKETSCGDRAKMKNFLKLCESLLGGLALVVSAVLSWILEYFIGNIAMLAVVLGGIIFAVLNPELMSGQ